LIHSEQGFGDVLQFVRYFKCLKQRGATVIVEVREALASLLDGHPYVDQLIIYNQDRPPEASYDYYVSIMDLPGRLGTTLETIPPSAPRLVPTERLKAKWRWVRQADHLNIGVVFSGNPNSPINPQRSFPAALLQPIATIPGVHCVSLQKGPPVEQLADLGWDLPDIGSQCQNFSDTAGVIENLDLVISMCTSVAHLAGIMHQPVWVLLAHRADWRWHLNTTRSPWYPTARLFRQTRPGDWASVFDPVHTALMDLVNGR
jgi:hypothetical protein